MKASFAIVSSIMAMLALSLAPGRSALGQDEDAGELKVIEKACICTAAPGDLIQVVFETQATPNGIRTLKLDITGDSVTRVAVVTSGLGGAGEFYKISAFLKAERGGKSTVIVTPVQFDGPERQSIKVEINVTRPPPEG